LVYRNSVNSYIELVCVNVPTGFEDTGKCVRAASAARTCPKLKRFGIAKGAFGCSKGSVCCAKSTQEIFVRFVELIPGAIRDMHER
jgi:hypothetical protein